MGREGPCYHCGITYTPLWRMGPPEKPVLCNACGSRWRIKGNLNDYVPKHAIRDAPSGDLHTLPSEMKRPVIINSQQKSEAGKEPEGSDLSSASLKQGKFGISSSGSSVPSPEKCMLTQGAEVCLFGEAAQGPAWNPKNVTRRKRSNLQQQTSSSINTLHRQLHHIQQDSEDESTSDHEEEDILIYQKWQCIPDNEIGFGAMLLKLSTAT